MSYVETNGALMLLRIRSGRLCEGSEDLKTSELLEMGDH